MSEENEVIEARECPVCPNQGFVIRKGFDKRKYKQDCHWCLETPESIYNQKKDRDHER